MGSDSTARVRALTDCIAAIHQQFGGAQFSLDHGQRKGLPANEALRHTVDIVVCTVKDMHLLGELPLPAGAYHHQLTEADPTLLGYECHAVLKERLGAYDFYCYLEDDLILHDPLLFMKLNWFNQVTTKDDLLQPNRYEIALKGNVNKVYVDGELPLRSTVRFQKITDHHQIRAKVLGQVVTFQRTLNPHSGAFFLSDSQMRSWVDKPYFLDRSASFIGPPESAATLGIMKTFRVYKPALSNAAFLELQHCGSSYLDLIGRQVPIAGDATPPAPQPSARRVEKPKDPSASVEAAVEEGLQQFDP